MRLATTTLYDRGLAAIDAAQRQLSATQQQMATGKRVNTAADDPVAATQILRTTSTLAINTQYVANQGVAAQLLGETDGTLGQVNDLLVSVRTTLVAANNAALSDSDRAALGAEVASRLDALVSLANARDGNGKYLFGGFRVDAAPFAKVAGGVTYNGDDGQRAVQVSAARQMDVTENGATVFNRIKSGNGVFATAAASSNAGSGVVDTGSVTDPTLLTGHRYQVVFAVASGATTYRVQDVTTGTTVGASSNPYTSGQAIAFGGMQLSITGAPANGDAFAVDPAAARSVFDVLKDAAAMLSTPSGGTAGRARLAGGLLSSVANLDNAIGHVSDVRATVGVRQNELDALGASAAATDTEGQARLSALQDVDYAKAVSEFAKRQTALEAAQKSFAAIANKSLFDYL